MNNLLKVLCITLSVISINTACYAKPEDKSAPYILYKKAEKLLKSGEYKEAAKTFGDITYKYPYYKFAAKSQVMEIYSHYIAQEYDYAIPTIENFIKLHAASAYLPYVYYIKGLCYYDQIDVPQRDQSITMDARNAFLELVAKFPSSEYAKDARRRFMIIDDHLAGQEMSVGRYYLNKGDILAAINRFQDVIQKYPESSHMPEALYRLVESYEFLGINSESSKYRLVLLKKHRNSQWYKDSLGIVG